MTVTCSGPVAGPVTDVLVEQLVTAAATVPAKSAVQDSIWVTALRTADFAAESSAFSR